MIESYTWRGGSEFLLRHGAGARITLLVLPALFEEANRMRRFTVSMMRELAARGIGSVLPDLPGTGESLTTIADTSLGDWCDAAAAVADRIRADGQRCYSIAIRGGALLDGVADRGWRLAPETGDRLLRDMVRATALTSGVKAGDIDARARVEAVSLAGNTISPELYTGLSVAMLPHSDRRVAPLADDWPRLWRAAEPGDDPAMVTAAADDIVSWVATCDA